MPSDAAVGGLMAEQDPHRARSPYLGTPGEPITTHGLLWEDSHPGALASRPGRNLRFAGVRFSLIIVTKARLVPLRAALESSARALPSDGEVIVVDGDPERSGDEVVREMAGEHPDLDLRYVPSKAGMTLQRNVGIDAAHGEVVVFVDDDCTFEPGLFEALEAAYRDPAVGGATGQVDA